MRIGLVNDPLTAENLRRALGEAGNGYRVAWTAPDGMEAIRRCQEDLPDLLLLDLRLPGLDGAETARRIMKAAPCAILLVTAETTGSMAKVSEALGAGALDVVMLPTNSPESARALSAALLPKIRLLAKIVRPKAPSPAPQNARRPVLDREAASGGKLVVIGASAGGPAALATLLGQLKGSFPVPIIVVQHVDAKFSSGLASWLDEQTSLRVRLAETGDRPSAGTVLIAGSNDHLIFTDASTLGYTPRPVEYAYRPSVDVFFASAAQHWRGDLLAVLLTGMGRDGANGLKILREKGYRTIAQDEATSAIYGMPKHAAAIGAAVDILPLQKIAPELERFFLGHPR